MTTAKIRETPKVTRAPLGDLPSLRLESWERAWEGLVAGVTHRGEAGFDMALFGTGPTKEVLTRWESLVEGTRCVRAVHSRQVHGSDVHVSGMGEAGMALLAPGDGHVTTQEGVLLTVATADCVPIFLLDRRIRALALLHAGWRGAAGGVLEQGLQRLTEHGSQMEDLHLHLGPSICGSCYEVGPEVFQALDQPVPSGPTPIDLPGAILDRARAAGIASARMSRSALCTKCGPESLYSHRNGDAGRQVAFLGWVDAGA